MTTNCPSQIELRAYSIGELPEEQSDLLFAHLRECDHCQGEISSFDSAADEFVAQLRDAAQPADDDSFSNESEVHLAAAKALGALNALDAKTTPGTSGLNDGLFHKTKIPESIGEYEIVQPIGKGGMGTVYLGRHTKLDREVAVKFLADHRLSDPRMHGRFAAEMKAIGKLKHPNIVTAHDAREVDGVAVLVTEYIDGRDVGQIVNGSGPLKVADAAQIAFEVAHALEYIEKQGLVHRDIKPSNVMVSREGEVKILDLGLARVLDKSELPGDTIDATLTGQAIGTPDYVSPEQINDGRNIDIRSDIYGLGATLFKLLTGTPPFPSDKFPTAFAKMTAHVTEPVPNLKSIDDSIPDGLASLVHRMLSKKPDDRPRRPIDVANELARFRHGNNLRSLVGITNDQPVLEPRPPVKSVVMEQPHPISNQNETEFEWSIISVSAAVAGVLLIALATALATSYLLSPSKGPTASLQVYQQRPTRVDKPVKVSSDQNKEAYYLAHFDALKAATTSEREAIVQSRMKGVWSIQSKRGEGFDEILFHDGRYQSRKETEFGSGQEAGTYKIDATDLDIHIDLTPDDPYAKKLRGSIGFRKDFAMILSLVGQAKPYPGLPNGPYADPDMQFVIINDKMTYLGPTAPPGGYQLYTLKKDPSQANELSRVYQNLFAKPAPVTRFFVGTTEKTFSPKSFQMPDFRKRELNYLFTGDFDFAPADFASATAVESSVSGQYDIEFSLNEVATHEMRVVTFACIGKRLVVVSNGKLISSTTITEPIVKKGVIEGPFTKEEATQIAESLTAKQIEHEQVLEHDQKLEDDQKVEDDQTLERGTPEFENEQDEE